MTPQISVIMPVRNGARWLRESVDSVLAQTFRHFELLAVDDGSTDETSGIMAGFAAGDDRVRVIRQDALGLVAALNRGLAEARGAFIARQDADDRAMPERLDRQFNRLIAHPEIGLLGSWARKIDDRGMMLGQLQPETRPEALAGILTRTNPFVHSSVMFRSEIARRLGGYRAAFQAAEDYDLWLRIAEVAEVAILPEPLIQYRWHGGNVTRRDAIRQAFSVRLAQRSAKSRREAGFDPADNLTDPPDWRSGPASFFAEDSALYRLLDVGDASSGSDASTAETDFSLLLDRITTLNHAERRLAARAIVQHIKRAPRAQAARTLMVLPGLLRRRPGMILLLAAALRRD